MPDDSVFGTVSLPVIQPLTAQADRVLKNAGSAAADDKKIEKSAKEFESILLGTWLQQAEKTFAAVPGGEEDDDADAGKDQFQSIAMQSLAASMTQAGGVGIAKIIAKGLHKAEDARLAKAADPHPAPSK
ncbi:MAG: rod-binding protein [Acidobacteriaceae bacterium]